MSAKYGKYKAGSTPYFERVVTVIQQMAGEGIQKASYYDIADRIPARVTSSLRRAMDLADENGLVTRTNVYSDRGGLMAVFVLHPDQKMLPLPVKAAK